MNNTLSLEVLQGAVRACRGLREFSSRILAEGLSAPTAPPLATLVDDHIMDAQVAITIGSASCVGCR